MIVCMGQKKNKPIIAVDVDGVLAPVCPIGQMPERKNRAWSDNDYVFKGHIAFIEPVVEFLKNIEAENRADIVFASSWSTEIYQTLDVKWGLAPGYSQRYGYDGWWKKGVIARLLDNNDRPVIWIDDDIGDALLNGELDDIYHENLMTMSPDTHKGLEPKDLCTITDMIDNGKRE